MCKTIEKINESGLLIRHIRAEDGRVFGSIVHTKPDEIGMVTCGVAIKHPKKNFNTKNTIKIALGRYITATKKMEQKPLNSNIVTRVTGYKLLMYGALPLEHIKDVCNSFYFKHTKHSK